MVIRLLGIVIVSGCTAMSPAPFAARHRPTAPLPDNTVSVALVVGAASQGLADPGYGFELRAMYQATPELSTGVGIGIATAPRADLSDTEHTRMWLAAIRGVAEVQSQEHDWVAFGAGIGFATIPTTGLVALTIDTSIAVSYTNDYLVPYAAVHLALSAPLLRGSEWGYTPKRPSTTWFAGMSLGLVLPYADRNTVSIDATGFAGTPSSGVGALSVASTHANDPD